MVVAATVVDVVVLVVVLLLEFLRRPVGDEPDERELPVDELRRGRVS